MELIGVVRTHNLEGCIIEGYKGYFSQWEITIEAATHHDVLKLCQDYCYKEKSTKEQFLHSLEYSLKECKGSYRSMFNIKSFYELERKDDKTWIYTYRRVPQDFV